MERGTKKSPQAIGKSRGGWTTKMTSVSSPRSILSFPLKVVEKAQDELCIEIGQSKSHWWFALMLFTRTSTNS